MIQVIILDFGGVLGPEANDFKNTYHKISELSGLTPQELLEIFTFHWTKLKVGQESMKDFWKKISLKSRKKVDPEKLRWTYNNNLFVNRDILKLIKKLKKKYKVVQLANDSDDDYLMKVKKLKLNKYFDKIYSSSNLGIAKPDREIFMYVLNDLRIKSQEVVFIDNQEKNYKVAKSLDINAILFTNPDSLKRDLDKIL